MTRLTYICSIVLFAACLDTPAIELAGTGNAKIKPSADPIVEDTTLRILTYGLPVRRLGVSTVTEKYGFQYYAVAGCLVYDELVDSVKKHNKEVYAILDKRWGPGWRDRLEAEIKATDELYQRIEIIAGQEKHVIEKAEELIKTNNGVYFDISPTEDAHVFKVKVFKWDHKDGKETKEVFFELLVNEKTNSANLFIPSTHL